MPNNIFEAAHKVDSIKQFVIAKSYIFEMSNKNTLLQIVLVLIGSAFAFVLIRFPFPGNLIALVLLFVLLLGYYLLNSYFQKKQKKEIENSFLGQMNLKREDCQQKIRQLNKELLLVDNNIEDLKIKLKSNPQASDNAVQETEKLIAGFEEEKKLRQSKIAFYDLCLTKFNQIIKNHQLTEDLKLKREKLEELKESNIDEVSDMEGMKTFIDYEKTYIETIDELSLQMLESRSIERAEALQLELVEMTKELKEL